MLISLLPPFCLLTGSSHRLKKISHHPTKVTRKEKRGNRAYLDRTEDGRRVQRDRGAAGVFISDCVVPFMLLIMIMFARCE